MDDLILLEAGHLPWEAASVATPGEILLKYDIPLIGLLEERGTVHLFRCISGEMSSWSIWEYVPLTAGDLAAIEAASPMEMDGALERAREGKPAVLALASEEQGIVRSDVAMSPSRVQGVMADLIRGQLNEHFDPGLEGLRSMVVTPLRELSPRKSGTA